MSELLLGSHLILLHLVQQSLYSLPGWRHVLLDYSSSLTILSCHAMLPQQTTRSHDHLQSCCCQVANGLGAQQTSERRLQASGEQPAYVLCSTSAFNSPGLLASLSPEASPWRLVSAHMPSRALAVEPPVESAHCCIGVRQWTTMQTFVSNINVTRSNDD